MLPDGLVAQLASQRSWVRIPFRPECFLIRLKFLKLCVKLKLNHHPPRSKYSNFHILTSIRHIMYI